MVVTAPLYNTNAGSWYETSALVCTCLRSQPTSGLAESRGRDPRPGDSDSPDRRGSASAPPRRQSAGTETPTPRGLPGPRVSGPAVIRARSYPGPRVSGPASIRARGYPGPRLSGPTDNRAREYPGPRLSGPAVHGDREPCSRSSTCGVRACASHVRVQQQQRHVQASDQSGPVQSSADRTGDW